MTIKVQTGTVKVAKISGKKIKYLDWKSIDIYLIIGSGKMSK